ncbi:hypothetical protein [Enterovibrio norvegicus]|uniref:Uncharacterized protein n=1 Tax=Enterovibrio norvegicus TaxID=188144 RepID=A0ABV4L566_9GAMM
MDIYNKIQSSVLACAVAALGASIYVSSMESDFKQYSIPLALVGSILGVSATGLGFLFSRQREKKLDQKIGSAINKFADEKETGTLKTHND